MVNTYITLPYVGALWSLQMHAATQADRIGH